MSGPRPRPPLLTQSGHSEPRPEFIAVHEALRIFGLFLWRAGRCPKAMPLCPKFNSVLISYLTRRVPRSILGACLETAKYRQ
jgi:hypothetical protein